MPNKSVLITAIADLRQYVREQRLCGKRIGLVPTMGALHEGHISLVRESNKQCGATIVSIFVNPAQFAPGEDFEKYPRMLENDLKLLQAAGSPAVFAPSAEEMYPAGFDANVHIGGVSAPLEGIIRPAHFDGVATVVLKLLNISQADTAFFGQKDYQQVCVVKKLAADLNVPVEIIMCPIVREPDGLAMSSRNRYLSAEERQHALILSQCLEEAKMIVARGGQSAKVIRHLVYERFLNIDGTSVEYVSIADPVTLKELTLIEDKAVILLAVRVGSTRLLDNVLVKATSNNP